MNQITDIENSSEAEDTELASFPTDLVVTAGQQPSHEYASPQVGLPRPVFHETEDERKNRLSDQHIAESRKRLMPEK